MAVVESLRHSVERDGNDVVGIVRPDEQGGVPCEICRVLAPQITVRQRRLRLVCVLVRCP